MSISIQQITNDTNLLDICDQMQPGLWDKDNDMASYQPESLKKFLERNDILLLACEDDKIVGAALCYELPHPAGPSSDSLYVHELDTHPDFRRQGIATQLMNQIMKIANDRQLSEVWLGTETNNYPALAEEYGVTPDETQAAIERYEPTIAIGAA